MLGEADVLPAVLVQVAVECDAAQRARCEDQLVGVGGADGSPNAVDQRQQLLAHVHAEVAPRLVEHVVGDDGDAVAVALGDALPEPRRLLLVRGAVEELVLVGAAGGAVDALAAGRGVEVEDHIQAGVLGEIDGAVEPLERVRPQGQRPGIVHQQTVVERNADHVEAEGPGDVHFARGDPVLAIELEQLGGAVRAEAGFEGGGEAVLIADALVFNSEHPGFDEQPAPQVAAAEGDFLARFVDQEAAGDVQAREVGGGQRNQKRSGRQRERTRTVAARRSGPRVVSHWLGSGMEYSSQPLAMKGFRASS